MPRPREFDPEEALAKATRQFRARGYHDTSIRDLVERTEVGPYGLYGQFESKHGLFLAALDHYRKTVTADVLSVLNRPGPARGAIASTLERVLKLMQTPDGRVGCLMCNTAIELAPHDETAAAQVRAHMKLLQDAFRRRLAESQIEDEIAPDADPAALAEFLTATVYGIGMLVRAGRSDAFLRRYIATALRALD